MPTTLLITGGAGYVGSHAVQRFLAAGYPVVVFDNLSRGYRQALSVISSIYDQADLRFEQGDLRSTEDLKSVFDRHAIGAVIHFAALCSVDESISQPELYFANNSVGSFNLLEAMRAREIKTLVFSSTCAVYGETATLPVSENHPPNPTNPYGESKLLTEKMLRWYGEIHGFKYAILRYFNVCGAEGEGRIGDSKKPSSLLVQNAVRGGLGLEQFQLTCPQTDTPDQSPIRDYINVEDLAEAHLKALNYLEKGGENDIFNLGTGQGYSVLEIIAAVEKILGVAIPRVWGTPRQGEYARIYAETAKAKRVLGFETKKTLQDSVQSLVKWYKKHPHGYQF